MNIKFDIQRRLTVLKFENMQTMNKTKQVKIDHKNRTYSEKKLNKGNKMMNSTNFLRSFKFQQIVKNDIKIYQFVNTSKASL